MGYLLSTVAGPRLSGEHGGNYDEPWAKESCTRQMNVITKTRLDQGWCIMLSVGTFLRVEAQHQNHIGEM